MKDWTPIQERYLRDAVPTRLGGIAANWRRIKTFATQEAGREAVASLIEESKHFIEWTARDAQIETAAQLVERMCAGGAHAEANAIEAGEVR